MSWGQYLLIAGRRSVGTWLIAGGTAALTIIEVLAVGAWLLLPMKNRFSGNPSQPYAIDGVIALGGGINLEISAARDQLAMDVAAERLVMLGLLSDGSFLSPLAKRERDLMRAGPRLTRDI